MALQAVHLVRRLYTAVPPDSLSHSQGKAQLTILCLQNDHVYALARILDGVSVHSLR